MAKIDGLDQVLSNIDKKEKAIYKAIASGIDYGLTETVNFIKEEYVWNKNHKGFNDITANLRNSISHKIDTTSHFIGKGHVYGWIYAGMSYAPYVELRWEGKHAYLYPGVKEKEEFILDIIKDAAQVAVKTLGI